MRTTIFGNDDYGRRCEAAIADQLTDVMAALDASDLDYDVQHTGGWCMAVTTPYEKGVVVVTTWDSDGPLVCCYEGDAWSEGYDPVDGWTLPEISGGVGRLVESINNRLLVP